MSSKAYLGTAAQGIMGCVVIRISKRHWHICEAYLDTAAQGIMGCVVIRSSLDWLYRHKEGENCLLIATTNTEKSQMLTHTTVSNENRLSAKSSQSARS